MSQENINKNVTSPDLKSDGSENSNKKLSGFKRTLRYLYLRFIRLRSSDAEVAKGLALGVFIGMTPTMGLQMFIALFFAMLLKENKFAAMLGVWITNPVTFVFIYSFNFYIGKLILQSPDIELPPIHNISFSEMLDLGYHVLMPLLTGCFVVGVVSAIITYFLALKFYKYIVLHHHKSKAVKR